MRERLAPRTARPSPARLRRRTMMAALLSAAVAGLAWPQTGHAEAVADLGTIRVDGHDPVFWAGPAKHSAGGPLLGNAGAFGGSNRGTPQDLCIVVETLLGPGPQGPRCWEWTLRVEKGGPATRLRLAMRLPRDYEASQSNEAANRYRFELYSPSHDWEGPETNTAHVGTEVTQANFITGRARTAPEIIVREPEAGDWLLRVVAQSPSTPPAEPDVFFRAVVEKHPTMGAGRIGVRLLPNLRPEPPFFLRFGCGGQPLPDTDPPPRFSGATCLRGAFGTQNAGKGRLILDFPAVDAEGNLQSPRVTQGIVLSDDTPWDPLDNHVEQRHDAGRATFHPTHAHYHHDAIVGGIVYRVDRTDGTPRLVPVGCDAEDYRDCFEKRGLCARNAYLVGRFEEFVQDPQRGTDSDDNCAIFGQTHDPQEGLRLGLGAGWADAYQPTITDQYVRFPADSLDRPQAGEFVWRLFVDQTMGPDGRLQQGDVLERDETDNVGYTWFSVGQPGAVPPDAAITVHERGRGADPWDPDKVVYERVGD